MEYTEKILKDLKVLKQNGSIDIDAKKLLKYGNLGNPQHNFALY